MPSPAAELMEEIGGEILLRAPPDKPTAPSRTTPSSTATASAIIPSFFPTTSTPCFAAPAVGGDGWVTLDGRHGRLLMKPVERPGFVVWDPSIGRQQHIPENPYPNYSFSISTFFGAVLCPVDRCEHLACQGGQFQVFVVCINKEEHVAWMCMYSSETSVWSTASGTVGFSSSSSLRGAPSVLLGDALCFTLVLRGLLKYNLGTRSLSIIVPPLEMYQVRVASWGGTVITSEDGGLGYAGLIYDRRILRLWSWKDGNDGSTVGWTQYRDISFEPLLPTSGALSAVISFAEGTDTILLDTGSILTVHIKAGKVRKVGARGIYDCFRRMVPYTI
ncbi:hypothetical protein ACP4OV_012165 [Aristida adscensionis]